MIDADVRELILRQVGNDIEDRRKTLGLALRQSQEQFTARGMFRSSMMITQAREIINREARVRPQLVWGAVKRTLLAAGVELHSLSSTQLRALVEEAFRSESTDLQGELDRLHKLVNIGPHPSADEAMLAALERTATEIELAVLASKRSAQQTEARTVNVYQTHGIVQLGANSVANLSIAISQEEKAEIRSALKVAEEAISTDPNLPNETRENALELVGDARRELDGETTNKLRLRGMLQGVATSIQTTASAPQAYQVMKGALALVGVDLP